ncbi:MAG: type IV pilus assembly protein PilM [Acidobacteriota bacterium]
MALWDVFKSRPKNLVGVDIGSSAVKIVALRKVGTQYRVEALGKAVLPPDTIVDGSVIAKLPLAEAIERVFREQKIRNNRVATSISGHSVIVKKVALPAMTEEELAQSIQWEAEQYIPFDLSEVNVDYQVVERSAGDQKLEVILVAAKKEKIADYTSVISLAGKIPVVVDIDAFALQNAYEVNYAPSAETVTALLDIGASSTNLSIVRGTEFLFTRDIAIGGHQYSEFLQEEFDISFEDAERYKRGEDVPEELAERVQGILDAVSQNLVLEVEKTLDYFKTTTYAEDVQQMYLTGGASRTPGLLEALSNQLQFAVDWFDPFQRIELPEQLVRPAARETVAAEFAIAVGLALRTQ